MTSPAFIVGSDRSGTTLLRLLVNEHSQLSVPAETWFLIDLIAEFGENAKLDADDVARAIGIVTSKRRWKNFSVDPGELQEALTAEAPVGLDVFFDRLMQLEIASTGKPHWVDKTPEYVLHIAALARVFPEARFVHISRDGRDVFASLQPKRWRGRTAWRIGQYWGSCIDSATVAATELADDRWLWIKYEDLVLDLEGTLRRVCEFLVVEFEPAMVTFHETAAENVPAHALRRGIHNKLLRPPDPSDTYRWRTTKPTIQTRMFEAVVDDQLRASGYETRLSSVAAWRMAAMVQHVVYSAWVKITKPFSKPKSEEERS